MTIVRPLQGHWQSNLDGKRRQELKLHGLLGEGFARNWLVQKKRKRVGCVETVAGYKRLAGSGDDHRCFDSDIHVKMVVLLVARGDVNSRIWVPRGVHREGQ